MEHRLGRFVAPLWTAGEHRGRWSRLAVMLGLTGFAISQPLLAVLGEEPTWFTFRDADGTAIVVFALVVALLPALVLWVVGELAGLARPSAGWAVHLVSVFALVGVAVVQLVKQAGLSSPALQVLVSVAFALGATYAYARFDAVGTWAQFTAVLPAITLGSFVFLSPTSDVIAPPEAAGAEGEGGGEDAPSVMVLMLDELPTESLLADDGTIDRVRFPHIAEFADESTWYRNYTSSAQGTLMAMPSILTGTPPREDAAINANYPDNLFSLLEPTHDMRVSEAVTSLCAPSTCRIGGDEGLVSVVRGLVDEATDVWRDRVALGEPREGLRDDFEQELESSPQQEVGFDGEGVLRRPEAQAEFLKRVEPVDEPTLWFLHLVLPHGPWRLYPDGSPYDPGNWMDPESYPTDHSNESGPWIAAVAEQRHLLQLEYADALVGQVLDRLKDTGEYDDTLVVLTADHGISFQLQTPQRTPVDENLEALAYVPLFLKRPGQAAGEVDESNASIYDLLPTIADEVGVEIPWEVAGAPLGSPEQQERDGEKEFYDFGTGFAPSFQGIFTFDDAERIPRGENRWIGPITADDSPIAGLLARIEVDGLVGRSIDDVATDDATSARASLERPAALASPPPDNPPGYVMGTIEPPEAGDDAVVVVEVNGSIVSGSPVITFEGQDGRFFAFLPPGALHERGNEIRLALMQGDEIRPLPID